METDNEICRDAHGDVGAVCRLLSKAVDRNPYSWNMELYESPDGNGYCPVMDALLPLLLYCVLPCVVLKSFCIEYSAKGAVQMVCLSTLLSLITLPVMLSLAAALGFA